jgi:hypothetical protein
MDVIGRLRREQAVENAVWNKRRGGRVAREAKAEEANERPCSRDPVFFTVFFI